MAGRGDEADAEAVEIVEGIAQRVDFQLAAIAGPRIHLADGKAAAEPRAGGGVELAREGLHGRVVGAVLGEGGLEEALEQELPHHQAL